MLKAGSIQSTGLRSSTRAQFSIYLFLLQTFLAYRLLTDESTTLAQSAGLFLISFVFPFPHYSKEADTHREREREKGEVQTFGGSRSGVLRREELTFAGESTWAW